MADITHLMKKETILVVDDTPVNLTLISEILKHEYKIKVANNGQTALKIAQSNTPPDLILLDIMMPDIDGYEVCKQLKHDTRTQNIPVIFLTAKNEASDEARGFGLGAVDYITKPICPSIILARIRTYLEMKRMHDFLRDQNTFLENEIVKRTDEIIARTNEIIIIQDVTIHALASLAETRDNETGNHIRRTQHYVKLLAEKLRLNSRFSHFLDDDKNIEILFKSAPLHDIGKVGIPDRILLKPGRFEPDEFEIMKAHPALGRSTLLQAESELDVEVPFLKYAKEIAYGHHEKWDGSGYPQGLSGDDIPISARLMAVADVYDALISRRVYKVGMPHEQAVKIVSEGKGSHFDPDMVDAFLELQDDFELIAMIYGDSEIDMEKKREYLNNATSELP
ncbi:MAG: two-component system response regulator [Methylococcales bacterium]|nr:two-component system response regulator [Methylococcales bacterium]